MSKDIYFENNKIIFRYEPHGGIRFILDKFYFENKFLLLNTLSLTKEDFLYVPEIEDAYVCIIIGNVNEKYNVFSKRIFNTREDIYFDKNIKINTKLLGLDLKFNIFTYLEKVSNLRQIKVLFDDVDKAIPYEIYQNLINNFPNYYEIKLYKASRIQSILDDFISFKKDHQNRYNCYLNKKNFVKDYTRLQLFKYNENELKKYLQIESDLNEMLKNEKISEKEWQERVLSFILLLFPKYITYINEFSFNDVVNCKKRRIDIALIDDNGNLDFIEIKKPSDFHLLCNGKYRDNYQPSRALAGSIMQAEKYIYYLSHLGKNEIDKLPSNKPEQQKLEKLGIKLKINNPKFYIIAGRTYNYNAEQLLDLEIIKRKYKNVIDIISYDDILNRLNKLIKSFSEVCD